MIQPKDIYILIACEESQAECQAFRDRGFKAYSCDIQPVRRGGLAQALAKQWGDFILDELRKEESTTK